MNPKLLKVLAAKSFDFRAALVDMQKHRPIDWVAFKEIMGPAALAALWDWDKALSLLKTDITEKEG